MKKQINLLTRTEKYQKRALLFHAFRMTTIIIGIVVFISLVIIYIISSNNKAKILTLESELNQLNSDMTSKKYLQDQQYIKNRLSLVNQVIKSENNYLLSFEKLEKYFIKKENYQVDSVQIDNQNDISMKISFPGKENLLEFMDFIQSPEFRSNFTNIKISRISYPVNQDKIIEIKLSAKIIK